MTLPSMQQPFSSLVCPIGEGSWASFEKHASNNEAEARALTCKQLKSRKSQSLPGSLTTYMPRLSIITATISRLIRRGYSQSPQLTFWIRKLPALLYLLEKAGAFYSPISSTKKFLFSLARPIQRFCNTPSNLSRKVETRVSSDPQFLPRRRIARGNDTHRLLARSKVSILILAVPILPLVRIRRAIPFTILYLPSTSGIPWTKQHHHPGETIHLPLLTVTLISNYLVDR